MKKVAVNEGDGNIAVMPVFFGELFSRHYAPVPPADNQNIRSHGRLRYLARSAYFAA
jgi:hypothetical protein